MFGDQAISGTQDLWEIIPTADIQVVVHEIRISVKNGPSSGNVAVHLTNASTSGSGGSVVEGTPYNPGDPADSVTVEQLNSTSAGVTGVVSYRRDRWVFPFPYVFVSPPEQRLVIGPGNIPGTSLIIKLESAPSGDYSSTVVFEERGE